MSKKNERTPKLKARKVAKTDIDQPISIFDDRGLQDGEKPFERGPYDKTGISQQEWEARVQKNEKEWANIVRSLKEAYHIDVNIDISDALHKMYQSIDSDFDLTRAVATDGYRYARADDFNFLQVEQLLDQAADLLDRAIRDRAEWQRLAVEAFNLIQDLTEYYELDKIHQQEIEKGFYTVAAKQSVASAGGEKENAKWHSSATQQLIELRETELTEAAINKAKDNSTMLASLPLSNHYKNDAFTDGGLGPGNAKQVVHYSLPGGGAGSRDMAASNYARLLFFHDSAVQVANHNHAEDATYGIYLAAKNIAQGLEAKADWDAADVDFRRARTNVARHLADLKAKAATARGGALNYAERMDPLQLRFERDFRDAWARMQAAQKGLEALYGYTSALPVKDTAHYFPKLPAPDPGRFFDECLVWVRDAIGWVVRFSHYEQNYALPVSVRTLVKTQSGQTKEQAWAAGLQTGTWEIELDESLFRDENLDQRHVRLRGLGACVVETTPNARGIWQVTAYPPKTSFCRYLSDPANGPTHPLDQGNLPPCRLSRVGARESIREADVVGTVAMHNASPFGVWKIKVKKISIVGSNLSGLEDVELDLHLAVRTK